MQLLDKDGFVHGQHWKNKYRKKVGLPTIDTFVKHYYMKPYVRYKIRNKYKQKIN